MKTNRRILMAVLASVAVAVVAQTNDPPTPAPAVNQMHITAVANEIDWPNRSTTYRGNVKVNHPQLSLTCELLTARLKTVTPQPQFERIVAETNVVVDAVDWEGSTNHCIADKLIYLYSVVDSITNQTLELSGNPRLTNYTTGLELSGATIIVDLVKGKAFIDNSRTSVRSEALEPVTDAFKAPRKETNSPPSTP